MNSAAIADDPGQIGFELQRRFRASPERVFRAWTQPVALREWWCPPGWMAGEIEVDLRVGGIYRIAMTRRQAVLRSPSPGSLSKSTRRIGLSIPGVGKELSRRCHRHWCRSNWRVRPRKRS